MFLSICGCRPPKIPSEGCAVYMRQELKTVSMVHKAISIVEQAQVG